MEKLWYKKGEYHVSPHNFDEKIRKTYLFPKGNVVKIFDSTLRKLHMTPGIHLSIKDKLELVRKSEQIGVAEIFINNIHFVKEFYETAEAIAKEKDTLVLNIETRLSEGWQEGIKKTVQVKADVAEIEARSSNEEMRRIGLNRESTIQGMCDALDYGKDLGIEVASGYMDSTRADVSFLLDLINHSIEHGASKLILYDSFGALTPESTRLFIDKIRSNLVREVPIVVHMHNMFGLGTANALAAVTAGAHVDVAANGLPTYNALAALEETVLAIELLLDIRTGIKLKELYNYCKLVEEKSGIKISAAKAVIGDHLFHYESDYEVAAHLRSNREENLKPFTASVIGRKATVVWGINTLIGDSVKAKLENMEFEYTQQDIDTINKKIKKRLDQIKIYPVWLGEKEVEKICRDVINKRG